MRRITFISVSLLLASNVGFGQVHPTFQRGFTPETSYEIGEIDAINMFNGNLTITLPIGLQYPVEGQLSYGLTLVYNSLLWDYSTQADDYRPSCNQESECVGLQATPTEFANAGLGWRLSLGELYKDGDWPNTGSIGKYLYVSPDGSRHLLGLTLHEHESPQDDIWYSRDNTYLRLTATEFDQQDLPTKFILEEPSGIVRTFEDFREGPLEATDIRLTKIEDRYSNNLSIAYTEDQQDDITEWVLTDSQSRVQKVYWTEVAGLAVVDKVELTTFGGGPAAVYQFVYDSAPEGTLITETCKDEHWGDDPDAQQTELTVPFLVAVQLPDGTSYQMKDGTGSPAYYTDSVGGAHSCEIPYSGILKRLILPTGGVYEWDFGKVEYPTGSGHSGCTRTPNPETMTAYEITAGVVERRIHSNTSDTATWTYYRAPLPVGPIDSVTTIVTTPDDYETNYYFRTQACRYDEDGEGYTAWTGWDYGLPFTPGFNDGEGRYRSVAKFEYVEGVRTLVRSQHVLYEHDQLPPVSSARDWYDTNRRVAETSTVFNDDGSRKTASTYSDFDGLGHYRVVTREGWGAGDRTETTNFNPGRGTYSINSNNNTYTGSFSLPSSGDPWTHPWILNTFDATTQVQDSVTAKQEHCFDSATGVLKRTRVLKSGTTRSASDIVTARAYDLQGNVESESYYGGDIQNNLNTQTAICALTLPEFPEYKVLHTYENGALKTSKFDGFDGDGFFSADRTIDSKTGLVSASRDVSTVETTFDYDSMGRVTEVAPAESARVVVDYTSAVSDVSDTTGGYEPAAVDIEYRSSGGALLAAEAFEFDGLGRVIAEKRKMPDDNWSERRTEFSDMGWLYRVSEFGMERTLWPKWTTYSGYDPFGRAHLVTRPDGSTTNLGFTGERVASQKVWIGTSISGETEFTTTTISDHLGRVTQVQEPLSVTTNYAYDIGGRLEQVDVVTTSGTQSRVFDYDNRGFLTSETMPEKGSSGNGSVSYSLYDSMGNVGHVVDSPSELTYEYDNVGRILEVGAGASCGPLTVRSFSYGDVNETNDLVLGKLRSASAINYFTDLDSVCSGSSKLLLDEIFSDGFESGDTSAWSSTLFGDEGLSITQMYVYGGPGGRVSELSTNISGDVFTQTYGWSELGQVASIDYPDLAGFTPPSEAISTLTYEFDNGFLRKVLGYANWISYHKNGALNKIQRVNGVHDVHAIDPQWIPRPRSIKAEKDGQEKWYTGVYAYDGAGNITDIGSDTFVYDGLSRLVQGTAEQGAKSQSYAYDGFGNITSTTKSVNQEKGAETYSKSVDASTNRLASPATYDSAGNLTSWDGNAYEWTPTGEMRSRTATGINRWFGYTADGERVVSEDILTGTMTYSLRDLSGKVLRVFEKNGSTWSWKKDYVYRDGMLLASKDPSGTLHFTLDHLGTPRFVSDEAGAQVAKHSYYGFGEKADDGDWEDEAMKFTGHERDLEGSPDAIDDLDYMHARYYNPNIGRFLSVDPVGGSVGISQSWNRYAYVWNNPIKLVDPSGQSTSLTYVPGSNGDLDTLFVVWNVEFYGEGATPDVVDQIVSDITNAYTGQVTTLEGKKIRVVTSVNARTSATGGEHEGDKFDQFKIFDSARVNKTNDATWTATSSLDEVVRRMSQGFSPMIETNSLAGGVSTGQFRTSHVSAGSNLPGVASHEFGHVLGAPFHVSGTAQTDPMSTTGDKTNPWFHAIQPYQASHLVKIAGQ